MPRPRRGSRCQEVDVLLGVRDGPHDPSMRQTRPLKPGVAGFALRRSHGPFPSPGSLTVVQRTAGDELAIAHAAVDDAVAVLCDGRASQRPLTRFGKQAKDFLTE